MDALTNPLLSGAASEVDQSLPPQILNDVRSHDSDILLNAVRSLRELIQDEQTKGLRVETMIALGLVSRLVQLLYSPDQRVQLEAAWALTNIAAGEDPHTQIVIEEGAVPALVSLLIPVSKCRDVGMQAVWALANIAGNGASARDYALREGAFTPLVAFLSAVSDSDRLSAWLIDNFYSVKDAAPDWELVSSAVPLLATRLIYSLDEEAVVSACSALSNITYHSDEQVHAITELGACPRLVELLRHPSVLVQSRAILVIGNIATCATHVDVLLASGVLAALVPLLSSSESEVRSDTCWVLTSILQNPIHIQAVIDSHLLPALLDACSDSSLSIVFHACLAISYATANYVQEPSQVRYLVSIGCIRTLCGSLRWKDSYVRYTLRALKYILRVGAIDQGEAGAEAVNVYAHYVEEAGAVNAIYELQRDPDGKIGRKARAIVAQFFPDVEVTEIM